MENNINSGLGLYRHFYKNFGSDFWGNEPAKIVRIFIEQNYDLSKSKVLDLGAGTGKNAFALAKKNAKKIIAIEIDSFASLNFLKSLTEMEESGLISEGKIDLYKCSAIDFLLYNTAQYDCIVAYGLLHVFKTKEEVEKILFLISDHLLIGGYLILQSLTNKYPAPISQVELEGTFITSEYLVDFFREGWEVIYSDQEDIVHSHLNSDENHRHGSVRLLLKKTR
ncbi:class I SAM-dependent methyltransferase [Flavobacterium filum]|uniref:class I SAM-dependent methyltransferase n=1 Tax=Flavobacterium filum TaxID=370974 RepID=UPI0023EFD801|nr:class I SAM-dependent methyltransferase [Flavobacterium filum]